MPTGFPCYVRVFHPAYDTDRDVPQPWETRTPVRWSEIAAARGTQVHPGMQLPAIARAWTALDHPQDGVFDCPPATGTLPEEVAPALAATLAGHTETPDRCWFAVWNGFGDIREDVRQAPTFRVPAREYFLVHGPIEAICDSTCVRLGWQSASIWWPDDHAWCVATEIDLQATYIACSEPCRDDLLAASELEALEADPATTGISWRSDTVNPTPPPRDGRPA